MIGGIVDWRFFYYGRCRVIVSDKGPGFAGPQWGVFCQTYGLVRVGVATLAAHRNGMVERQIGLLKDGIRPCREMTQMWTADKITKSFNMLFWPDILRLSSVPEYRLVDMSGGNDLLAALGDTSAKLPPNLTIDSDDIQVAPGYAQLLRIVDLRSKLSMFEANRVANTRSGRRLRMGGKEAFIVGDAAEVSPPTEKMRQSSFRAMGLLSSRLILERGRRLSKHPRCWVRRKRGSSTITLGPEDVSIIPKENNDAVGEAPSSSPNIQVNPSLNSTRRGEELPDLDGAM